MTITMRTCAVLTCDSSFGCFDDGRGEHVDATDYPAAGTVEDRVRNRSGGEYWGWWSDGTIDICPECAENPQRHDYVWRVDDVAGCRVCAEDPERHRPGGE